MVSLFPAFELLTLISDIAILVILILFLFRKNILPFFQFLARHALLCAFTVALTATVGSLYLSEILDLVPCELCWFQRIFMYPLPIIFGIALWKKDKGVWQYTLPLAIIGSLFSVYHYYIQRFPVETVCSATGPTCAAASFAYSYISIPVMALTAFVIVIGLGVLSRK